LELVGVEFAGEVGELELQTGLGVCDGAVVDGGTDLFEDEVEEEAGGHIANGFGKIFFKVTLEGCDGVGTLLPGELDGGHGFFLRNQLISAFEPLLSGCKVRVVVDLGSRFLRKTGDRIGFFAGCFD